MSGATRLPANCCDERCSNLLFTVALICLAIGNGCQKAPPLPPHQPDTLPVTGVLSPAPEANPPSAPPARTHADWLQLIRETPLAEMGQPDVVQSLTEIIADPAAGWEVRRQLALTLGRIGTPAASSVPTFRTLLRNEETDPDATRLWSLKALGLMGLPAAAATDDVAEIVLDSGASFLIRATAMETLARIGAERETALKTLNQVLQADMVPGVPPALANELRMTAAEAISLLGSGGTGALPELLRASRADWALLRRSAITAIGKMGPAAAVAVPALSDILLFDDAGEVNEAAADALGQLGPEGVAQLAGFLKGNEVPVQRLAVRGLKLAAKDPAAESALSVALADQDHTVRAAAAAALLVRAAPDPRAAQVLVNLLSSPHREARRLAYAALRNAPLSILQPYRTELERLRDDPHSGEQTVTAARVLLLRLED